MTNPTEVRLNVICDVTAFDVIERNYLAAGGFVHVAN
jgi:hypothetical protein